LIAKKLVVDSRRSTLATINHQRMAILAFLLFSGTLAQAQGVTSIVNSPHNLSSAGPGQIRATAEQEICIFCHTPHRSTPRTPLWNRNLPVSAYTVYSSSSLKAIPGQPTGTSKLCLSCHDGTIAVGSILSRGQPVAMSGGITTLPPGKSNLGTDLSDDHPISFTFDDTLAARDPKIKSPESLPPAVRLERGQVQCGTCHDAHNNQYGKFLVMNNSNSQLCNTCHNRGVTDVASHTQCAACHKPHTAPSRAFLLAGVNATATCTRCHSSTTSATQGANIAADLNKFSRHDTNSPVDQKDHIPSNVTCSDCHEGHTMLTGTAIAPNVSPKLGRIDGIDAQGAKQTTAQFEYEVCFKCHDNLMATQPYITRKVVQNNKRLQFAPSAVSFHPVESTGKNMIVPSLRSGWTAASRVYCTDCHSSDTGKTAGSGGPSGPHGSTFRPLLIARYDTTDNTAESAATYALCYRCHDEASILSNQSFPLHKLHIVDKSAPCSICHDPHGISAAQGSATTNSHLMNFDITIVRPDSVTGRLEYNSTGVNSGRCFLQCHGFGHPGLSYGAQSPAGASRKPVPAPARSGVRKR
jgi:predicted CXXCH cytochrome family protein